MKRPNFLWLMTDEQRCDSLGCYGSPWARTPRLDRLANEGVRFDNAVTPAPVCVPARLSLLTGRCPFETGVWWNHSSTEPAEHLTYNLRDAGYRTAHFGRSHYMSPNNAFEYEQLTPMPETVGCTMWHNEKYDPATHEVVQYPGPEAGGTYPWVFAGRWPADAHERMEARTARDALDWINAYDTNDPFLLRVSFLAPHTPVVPPAPYDKVITEPIVFSDQTKGMREDAPVWLSRDLAHYSRSDRLTAEQQATMRRHYYGEVAHVDTLFGQILDALEKRQLLEDTVVVFVSDHGAHLGDYGLVQKQTFYEPSVKVPYFYWNPRYLASGYSFDTPVETRGLLPTLMGLAGLEPPDFAKDASVVSSIRCGSAPDTRPVYSAFSLGSFGCRPDDRLVMVQDGEWKLSVCLDTPDLDGSLHNLTNDPFERQNRFHDSACSAVRKQLLDCIRERVGDR